jgi:hypothetical protein
MPAQRRIRAPRQRRVDRHIDAPERATQPTRTYVHWGTAMAVPQRLESAPEPISIVRCRELLGDEAETLSDDEVREVARHADAMARLLIVMATRDVRIH